jgi:hypothetical protein
MQLIYKSIIMMLFVVLSGCISHEYVWNEYPLVSGRISPQLRFTEGRELNIIKGKSDNSRILLGKAGLHRYYGTRQSLTDGIAVQLAEEMRNKRLKIVNSAKKSLEIVVGESRFEPGFSMQGASIEVTVKFGDGKTKLFTVKNKSPQTGIDTVNRIYDGVVALSVIEIIHDPEVVSYINEE